MHGKVPLLGVTSMDGKGEKENLCLKTINTTTDIMPAIWSLLRCSCILSDVWLWERSVTNVLKIICKLRPQSSYKQLTQQLISRQLYNLSSDASAHFVMSEWHQNYKSTCIKSLIMTISNVIKFMPQSSTWQSIYKVKNPCNQCE